jgi:hypothetical protein
MQTAESQMSVMSMSKKPVTGTKSMPTQMEMAGIDLNDVQ